MAPAIVKAFSSDQVIRVTKAECDVRDIKQVFDTLDKYYPAVVINLAGVSTPVPINHPISAWRDEIEVNLVGSFNIAQICTTGLNPVMIFMGSVAGKYGKSKHSGYSASKAGVISLVQSLAQEGHMAYAISPGRVDTKMRERDFPGEDPRTRLTTEQIAGVVKEILYDKYTPGDNIIIRKIGYETYRKVDRGAPWKKYLNIGGKIFV